MPLPIRRRPPKEFTLSFTDQPVTVKPLSADQMGKIEERFPYDADAKIRPNSYAFHAAIMASSCFDKSGDPAFTETQLRVEIDSNDFWELWGVVSGHMALRDGLRDGTKN